MKHINKRTARVLTIKELVNGELYARHYVEVGGLWYYNGDKSFYLDGLCESDGFFREPFSAIIKDSPGSRFKDLMLAYPNRIKAFVALRTWTLPNGS